MGIGDFLGDAWDIAKKTADVGFHAMPQVALGGLAVDLATAPWNDDEEYNGFKNTLQSRFATRLGDFLEPIDIAAFGADEKALAWAIPALHHAKSYGITRPLATLTLAFDEDVTGGGLPDFRAGWNASKDISPGRAWAAAIFGGNEELPGPLGAVATKTGRLGDPDFDITNPADREAAFTQGFGMYVSGLGDFVVSWNYDPLVLAGRGIGAARQAAVVKPIRPGMSDDALDKMTTAKYGSGGIGDKLTRPFDAQRRVTKIFDDLSAMQPYQRADWLSRNKTFAPNVGVQQLLTRAKDADEMRMIMRAAVDGSERNMTQLAEKSLRAHDELITLKVFTIPTLDRALAANRLGNGGLTNRSLLGGQGASDQMKQVLEAQMAHLNERLRVADQEYGFAAQMEAIAGTITQVPRVSLGQKLATTPMYKYDKLNWEGPTWAVFQPSKYAPATRVLKSAGTRRAQTVDFNRPGSATEAVKRNLDRTGHGYDKAVVPGRGLHTRGMDPAIKGALIDDVARAENAFVAGVGSQTAIAEAVQNAERVQLLHYGRAEGMDEDAVRVLYDEFATRRQTALGGTEAKMGGKERFSAVPRPGEKGKYLDDVYDNNTGEWVINPLTTSQFKDTLPMMDIDMLTKAMSFHREALKGENAKHFIARIKGSQGAVSTNAVVEEALSKFNRIWKPAQLFRLGWPLRVITDEQFRVIATVGLLTHLPLLAQSAYHSAGQTRLAYRARDLTTEGRRMKAVAEIREGSARFKAKAGDLERAAIQSRLGEIDQLTKVGSSTVDNLYALDRAIPALDAQITAAGERLRAAGKSQEGTRLHVTAPQGAKFKPEPRGVRFHLDESGRPLGPLRPGETTHARMGLNLSDESVYLPASQHSDAGIAALEDLLPAGKFNDVMAMSNKDLRVALQREVGPGVSIARYKTREELLSVYGATLARRQGYKAIYHMRGSEQQYHFVALTDDAVRAVDDTALSKAADELERLRIKRDTLAAERAALTGREAALPPWTQAMQQEWDELMDRAVKPSRQRKAEGPRPKFSGTRTTTVGGMQIGYDDGFGGGVGRVYKDLSSARSTVRSLAGAQDRYVNGLRLGSGSYTHLSAVPPKSANTRALKTAHDKSYARAYERAVNDQLGNNLLASKLLSGMDEDAVTMWLTRTREGDAVMRQNQLRASDPARWVAETKMQIEQYLPTPALRQAALEGKATADMLAREITDPNLRPIIHGESLELTLGTSAIGKVWERTVTALYDKLGTVPTDTLSRHPFFTASYRQEMERQINAYMAKTTQARTTSAGGEFTAGKATVSQAQIIKFQNNARQHALKRTKETLYDVANSSNLAHTFRFISPFYAAWQDALTTWGRLWLEDPSRLAHMMQVWQAPSKSHLAISEDPVSGKEYVTLPLPDFVKKAIPQLQGDMPTEWMKTLIFNGDYWMMPGAGAPVTLPLQELTRQRPEFTELFEPLIPYGAGESILDDVLPAGYRRLKTSWSKEDDYAWASAYQRNAMDVYFERRTGKFQGDDTAMYAEAQRRTEDFYRVRTWANFTLPYSPKFKSEHQFYYDQAAAMREQYAQMPNGKDPGGKSWEEAWIDKYGEDYFIFTASATKSNIGGVPATTAGFKLQQKYKDLIAANPDYGALIVGPEAFGDEFNSEVFQYQRNNAVGGGNTSAQRELRSPEEQIHDSEVARGWDRYRRIDTVIDNLLSARGLRSINAKGASDLKILKEVAVTKIARELPGWNEARMTFTRGKTTQLVQFLEANIDEEPFAGRAYQRTLAEYLAKRRMFVAILKSRQSQNLQAAENDDLRLMWDIVVNKLRQSDTEFADMHSRYLSNDDRLDNEGMAA